MEQRTLLISIVLSFFMACPPLKAQTTTMFNDETFSLGGGVGIQYAVIGIHAKYFFSDYIGAVASTTYSPYGLLWQAGVELRIPEVLPRRISPYLNLRVGTNSYSALNAGIVTSTTFEFVEERKSSVGLTFSLGVKWDILNSNSSYLMLGFDIRFVNKSHVTFVDEFNAKYLTSYGLYPQRYLPSIGYVFCLNRKEN